MSLGTTQLAPSGGKLLAPLWGIRQSHALCTWIFTRAARNLRKLEHPVVVHSLLQ